jgi:hypothetical protein
VGDWFLLEAAMRAIDLFDKAAENIFARMAASNKGLSQYFASFASFWDKPSSLTRQKNSPVKERAV